MQLCFVLMPFGKKPGPSGQVIDFDAVWRDLIEPAVRAAGLDPIRADEEQAGGIIHKAMFERLILCDYAVADLTTANANVFYELGVRHGIKPWHTTLIFASNAGPLPFDVAPLRGMPYQLDSDGQPAKLDEDRQTLTQRLVAARAKDVDSPVYQLVEGFPDIQHEKTDVFRTRVDYSREVKRLLLEARTSRSVAKVREVEDAAVAKAGSLEDAESGIVVDLFLSYRALSAWSDMARLARSMSRPLAGTTMVREQRALALNRAGDSAQAEALLLALIAEKGPSSETCGILGRVYKDRWTAAIDAGQSVEARGWSRKAIAAYMQGFEADWRDTYPGINAVTLMELADPPDSRRQRIAQVVSYSLERTLATGRADYWAHATRLELAIIQGAPETASEALADALAHLREGWEAETTLKNLRAIAKARQARGQSIDSMQEALASLETAAARKSPDA